MENAKATWQENQSLFYLNLRNAGKEQKTLLLILCMTEKITQVIDMMINVERFECEDKYEAEKLAGLTGLQKDHSTYIRDISDVIENEIIVILKDRTSHCVLMKDSNNAERLNRLLSDVLQGKKTISQSSYRDYITEIVLSE